MNLKNTPPLMKELYIFYVSFTKMMETSCDNVNFLPELNTPKGTLHLFPFKM